MFLLIIIKLSQTVRSYGLHFKSFLTEEIARKSTEQKLSFLYATLLLNLIYVPTKYQIISSSMGVIACTGFRLQGRRVYNGKKSAELFLLHMTCLLVFLCIPTKYYQNTSKGIKVMARTSMRLRSDERTEGRQADRYIP